MDLSRAFGLSFPVQESARGRRRTTSRVVFSHFGTIEPYSHTLLARRQEQHSGSFKEAIQQVSVCSGDGGGTGRCLRSADCVDRQTRLLCQFCHRYVEQPSGGADL